MFDVGFSEILVIALVALIVIGPERLPKVARMLGHLFGRLQRYVAEVKADIDREMQMDELKKLQSNMQEAARDIEQSVNREVHAAESQVSAVTDDLEKAADSPTQTGAAASPPKQP
ncbi:MAG: Sec-independent protein translocase protein TatB [Burkholderiales bacterium]